MQYSSQHVAVPLGSSRARLSTHREPLRLPVREGGLLVQRACVRVRVRLDLESPRPLVMTERRRLSPSRWIGTVDVQEDGPDRSLVSLDVDTEIDEASEVLFLVLVNGLVTLPLAEAWKARSERRARRFTDRFRGVLHEAIAGELRSLNPYRAG